MQFLSLYVGLFSVITYFLVQSLVIKWRRYQTAKQRGCQPVNKYSHTRPFGFDLYYDRIEAVKAGRLNKFNQELFEKYGSTYEERTLTGRIINTTETANFQAVGANKFEDFGRDARRAAEPFFGQGILSSNGRVWKQARDLVTPLFKRAELNDVENFKKFTDRMLALIPRDGSTVDMQPLLQKLFLDSSTEFIFGESIDSLRDTTGKPEEFLNAFNKALAGAGKRLNMGGAFSFLYMFDMTWKEDYTKVHAFIDQQIARYSDPADSKVDPSDQRHRYVLIEGMAREIQDPIELRFQLLNIFFPARDTSAIAVSNTLFFLARNPEIWTELRQQALKFGDQPLTFERLKSLHSFRYTLFEGIRLQGPSGQTRREALRDTTLPRGGGPDGSSPVFVPKGTYIYLNNFPKMYDTSVWGEDVEAFRPSRFEGKLLNWEFTPFFGGPRICPAINQVISQSVYLLVRLVTEFESIENRDECFEYVEQIRMLCESRNGIKIALHPAKS